jgi:hypothetical protein
MGSVGRSPDAATALRSATSLPPSAHARADPVGHSNYLLVRASLPCGRASGKKKVRGPRASEFVQALADDAARAGTRLKRLSTGGLGTVQPERSEAESRAPRRRACGPALGMTGTPSPEARSARTLGRGPALRAGRDSPAHERPRLYNNSDQAIRARAEGWTGLALGRLCPQAASRRQCPVPARSASFASRTTYGPARAQAGRPALGDPACGGFASLSPSAPARAWRSPTEAGRASSRGRPSWAAELRASPLSLRSPGVCRGATRRTFSRPAAAPRGLGQGGTAFRPGPRSRSRRCRSGDRAPRAAGSSRVGARPHSARQTPPP